MAIIARQPNGLLCRHSTVVDCVTDYNMTEEDYIKICMESARRDAEYALKHYIRPFELVVNSFAPNNITKKQFDEILREMKLPKEQCKHTKTWKGGTT